MKAKSGKAGKAVKPGAPQVAEDADIDDPGEIAEIKAAQRQKKEGKYGSEKVKAHKPGAGDDAATDGESEEEKKSWIEIELIDEEDQPVAGERYQIELPDGSVAKGTLDQDGFARVDGIDPGTCKVTFPELDKEAWEKA
ncbi:MAG: hypothetical protein PVG76_10755 [Chromatiales bacterium]|jgi:hypothetical protein